MGILPLTAHFLIYTELKLWPEAANQGPQCSVQYFQPMAFQRCKSESQRAVKTEETEDTCASSRFRRKQRLQDEAAARSHQGFLFCKGQSRTICGGRN